MYVCTCSTTVHCHPQYVTHTCDVHVAWKLLKARQETTMGEKKRFDMICNRWAVANQYYTKCSAFMTVMWVWGYNLHTVACLLLEVWKETSPVVEESFDIYMYISLCAGRCVVIVGEERRKKKERMTKSIIVVRFPVRIITFSPLIWQMTGHLVIS